MLETRVLELYLGHLVLVASRGTTSAARPQHSSRQLEIQRCVPSARAAAAATDSRRGPSLPKEPHGADSQPDPSRRRRLRGPSWGGSRSYRVQILLKGGAATPAVRQHGSHAEPETPPNHSRPPPRLIPGRLITGRDSQAPANHWPRRSVAHALRHALLAGSQPPSCVDPRRPRRL
ncbi:hypothetical protein NN561_017406 [Cricetulus griseus]